MLFELLLYLLARKMKNLTIVGILAAGVLGFAVAKLLSPNVSRDYNGYYAMLVGHPPQDVKALMRLGVQSRLSAIYPPGTAPDKYQGDLMPKTAIRPKGPVWRFHLGPRRFGSGVLLVFFGTDGAVSAVHWGQRP